MEAFGAGRSWRMGGMSDTRGVDTDANQRPSEMDDSDLASYIQGCVTKDREAAGEWREEARECYDFRDGRQWDEADVAALDEQGRPTITFNRTAPMLDAIAGAQVNNRQEMKFLPRSGDDGGKAEVWGGVIRWVRDQCDAEDEESEAFLDTATCGMGWTETRMDYDEDDAGKIIQERVDPFEMGWDHRSRKRNLADATHVWRKQRLDPDYVADKWPAFGEVGRAAYSGSSDAPARPVHRPSRDAYGDNDDTSDNDVNVTEVTHFQWCERRPEWKVLNPIDGELLTLDSDQWEALGEKLGEAKRDGLRHQKMLRKSWWQVFESGGEIADKSECPDPQGSTFKCITGRRDRNKRMFYGVVRAVIDPQRWANKWLSQALHIINTNAKSGVLAEVGAIADIRKFEESYAKTGTVTMVAEGALAAGRIQPKTAPPFPQGFDRLLQMAITSIPDVTGINREMLGTVDREQPGVLEAQRKQAAQAVLAPLFDSLRRYYKEQGRLLMVFAQKYIPPDKMIRIIMPDGKPETVQMAMLQDVTQFDIVIDQAPTSPNQKAEVWSTLQPALPALLKLVPGPIILKLLKFSPLPASVVEEMEQQVAEMSQQPPPPDPAAEKAKAEIEMAQAKVQSELTMKQADMQIKQRTVEMDFARDVQKSEFDMQMARMKADQQMTIDRMKAENDMAIRVEAAAMDADNDRRKAAMHAEESMNKMMAERGVFAEPVAAMIKPLAAAIDGATEAQREMAADNKAQTARLEAMMMQLAQLVSAPKEVVRGSDGRVSGVRMMAH